VKEIGIVLVGVVFFLWLMSFADKQTDLDREEEDDDED
jgi:hypothetical protein